MWVWKTLYRWEILLCLESCYMQCKNGKCLAGVIDDSVIMRDEIQKKQKQSQQILKKKMACKTQNFYILLTFFLITIAWLPLHYYYYLIKYWAKQKYL